LRRSIQVRRKTKRYSPPDFDSGFVLFSIEDDPKINRDSIDSKEGKLWKKDTVQEMEALDKNEVWDMVKSFDGIKPFGRKWMFKKELNAKGKVEKYKDHLVAKEYSQVEGIDFGEIFSQVAKLTFIRFLLSLATTFYLEVEKWM
jgi:hypothetical protein